MSTDIISPEGAASGTLLSPGHGSLLPHGIVWPHSLPKPEDFHLPQIAVPTFSRPLVSSHITGAPPASGGPGAFRQGIATALTSVATPRVPTEKARGPLRGVRRVSRKAVDRLSGGVQRVGGFGFGLRGVPREGGSIGGGRGIRPFGIRWG